MHRTEPSIEEQVEFVSGQLNRIRETEYFAWDTGQKQLLSQISRITDTLIKELVRLAKKGMARTAMARPRKLLGGDVNVTEVIGRMLWHFQHLRREIQLALAYSEKFTGRERSKKIRQAKTLEKAAKDSAITIRRVAWRQRVWSEEFMRSNNLDEYVEL